MVEQAPNGQYVEVPESQWVETVHHDLSRADIEQRTEELRDDYSALQMAHNRGRGPLRPKEQAAMKKYGWTGALATKTRDMDPWLEAALLKVGNDYSALTGSA
jgi:hypothetical protein